MFYEEDQINKITKCPICRQNFNLDLKLPIILLCCNETVCKSCVDSLVLYAASMCILNDNLIRCKLCHELTNIPLKGFPVNKMVLKLIENKPKDVYRGKYIELLKSKMIQLKHDVNELKASDSTNRIKLKTHCDHIRNEIEVATESCIEHINRLSKELMNKVEIYEWNCLKYFDGDKIKQTYDHMELFMKEMEQFCDKCELILKSCSLNEDEILRQIDLANEKKLLVDNQKLKQKNLIFNGKLLKYKGNDLKMKTNKLLGHLFFEITESSLCYDELDQIDLNKYLANKHLSHKADLIFMADGNFLLSFVNLLDINLLHFLLIDKKDLSIIRSLDLNGNFYFRKLVSFKNQLIFHSYINIGKDKTMSNRAKQDSASQDQYYLLILDDKLNKKTKIVSKSAYMFLDANDSFIYGLTRSNIIHVLNWNLEIVKQIETIPLSSSSYPNELHNYYLKVNNERIYLRNSTFIIQIYNEDPFDLVDQIKLDDLEMNNDSMVIDSYDRIIYLVDNRKIVYYNLDGFVENEFTLNDVPNDAKLKILLDDNDNLMLFSTKTNILKSINFE